MRISIELPHGRRVAEVSNSRVTGLPGAGVHVMVCHLTFQGYRPPKTVLIRNPEIRVELERAGGPYLGTAREDHQSVIEINNGTSDVQMTFRVPLNTRQVEHIEDWRNGGMVPLNIWFMAEAAAESGIRSIRDQDQITVSQSDWVQFLEDSGYKRILLYEIERPRRGDGPDDEAFELLERAHAELLAGRYDECVQKCRHVIDILEQSVPKWKDAKKTIDAFCKNKESRETMDKDERITFLLMAVRHATHPAHHGAPVGFSRHQAKAIFGSLVSIMSEVR